MKTTNFIFAAVIIMITMMFSNSVNSQTITLPTGVTKLVYQNDANAMTGDFANGGKIMVEFSEPVDLTITSLNSAFTISTSVITKGTSNISTTFSSTSKISVKMLVMTFTGIDGQVKITAVKNTSVYTAIKASGSSLPCDTTTAHNNGYNAGFAAGKATCGTTKTEVLKSAEVSVYPNPADSEVNVEVDNSKLTSNVSDLISGYYLIQIMDMTGRVIKTEKLMKQ